VTRVAWTDQVRTVSHPEAESNGPTIVGWLGPGDQSKNHHAMMVVNEDMFVPFRATPS
jgi:hypothetical protein